MDIESKDFIMEVLSNWSGVNDLEHTDKVVISVEWCIYVIIS